MIIVNLDVELAKKKMRSGELAERIGITPVSYTHLDVYKRQVLDLPYRIRSALSLETALVHVKTLPAGQDVGYGCLLYTSRCV